MKFLTDIKKIAQKINIEHVPVLTIDITKGMDGYPDCYEGSKVRIVGAHKGEYADLDDRCTVRMYGDQEGNENHESPWLYKTIKLYGEAVFLKGDYGLRDVDEMVEWSNTRAVHAGEKVLVYFRGKDVGFLRLMKISDHVDPFCSTVARLEDI